MKATHKWAAPCWQRIGASLRWPVGTLSGAAYRLGGLAVMSALEFDRRLRWHVSVSKAVEGKRVLPSDEERADTGETCRGEQRDSDAAAGRWLARVLAAVACRDDAGRAEAGGEGATMKRVRVAKGCDRKLAAQIRRVVLRLRLDRRKVYCEADGLLSTEERFTARCSGCAFGHGGCRECGYTGKRVTFFAAYAGVAGELVRLPARGE